MILTFGDGISAEEFHSIVANAVKTIKKRKITYLINAHGTVKITVLSQSNLSSWEAYLDFNDFGHLTGRYWIYRWDGTGSRIPDVIAERIRESIHTAKRKTNSVEE